MVTHRIDECAQVKADRVKCNDAHGLQRVAVNNIACDDGIAHLDAGGKEEKGNLADYPVVSPVNTDSPDN